MKGSRTCPACKGTDARSLCELCGGSGEVPYIPVGTGPTWEEVVELQREVEADNAKQPDLDLRITLDNTLTLDDFQSGTIAPGKSIEIALDGAELDPRFPRKLSARIQKVESQFVGRMLVYEIYALAGPEEFDACREPDPRVSITITGRYVVPERKEDG